MVTPRMRAVKDAHPIEGNRWIDYRAGKLRYGTRARGVAEVLPVGDTQ